MGPDPAGVAASSSVLDKGEDEPGAAIVELRRLTKRYGPVTAIDDCNLAISRREFVSLLGPSGCGKTTLLKMIGGLVRPDEGRILIHGRDLTDAPPNKRPVNTVFQSYALFPHKTVIENVLFPLEIEKVPRRERLERARESLELVRMTAHASQASTSLSGGQAQRVALARAVVGRPDVLLLDEPLAALDLKLRKAMQSELRRIHETLGTTFVYVTHDQSEALAMSDRVILMDQGRVVQDEDPRSLYDRPASMFAYDFVGAANLLPGIVEAQAGPVFHVRCGQHPVTGVSDYPLDPGSAVVVCVRPERIILDTDPSRGTMAGTLASTTFLGNVGRCAVDVGDGILVTVEGPRADADRWLTGMSVGLRWAADAALLMPSEGP